MLRRYYKSAIDPVEVPVIDEETIRYDPERMRTALLLLRQVQLEHPDAGFFVYYIPLYEELTNPEVRAANEQAFGGLCEELGIPWHSPAERFLATGDPSALYIEGDGHFTAAGAAEVARHLAELL